MGVAAIKLTGGEPLMHERISDIIGLVAKEGFHLTIETNGSLCTPEIASMIAGIKNHFVSVSLDAIDAKTHDWLRGVPGGYVATVDGIQCLIDAGIKPQIIMSVLRRNRSQMKDMVSFAENIGAKSVKFNIIMPTKRGKTLHDNNETLSIEELVKAGIWVENNLIGESKIPIFYHHPPAFRPLGRMYGQNGDGCGNCNIKGVLGVLADGSYALCGIGSAVPELIFGNAKKDGLQDVWQNTPVLRELRDKLPERLEGICKDCLMKNACLGGCIAQNYYRSNNLWAPFWYCHQAHLAGLFPASRIRP